MNVPEMLSNGGSYVDFAVLFFVFVCIKSSHGDCMIIYCLPTCCIAYDPWAGVESQSKARARRDRITCLIMSASLTYLRAELSSFEFSIVQVPRRPTCSHLSHRYCRRRSPCPPDPPATALGRLCRLLVHSTMLLQKTGRAVTSPVLAHGPSQMTPRAQMSVSTAREGHLHPFLFN